MQQQLEKPGTIYVYGRTPTPHCSVPTSSGLQRIGHSPRLVKKYIGVSGLVGERFWNRNSDAETASFFGHVPTYWRVFLSRWWHHLKTQDKFLFGRPGTQSLGTEMISRAAQHHAVVRVWGNARTTTESDPGPLPVVIAASDGSYTSTEAKPNYRRHPITKQYFFSLSLSLLRLWLASPAIVTDQSPFQDWTRWSSSERLHTRRVAVSMYTTIVRTIL